MTALSNNYSNGRANSKYKSGKMEDLQKKAIAVQVTWGKKLQELHPEVVDFYRGGKYIKKIAEELNICYRYSLTKNNAVRAITYALNGFNGIPSMNLSAYSGLLDENEKKEIVRQHQRTSGLEIAANEKGFFALSDDERRKFASDAGKKAYQSGKGIHGFSYEQRSEAGKKAVILRGNIPLVVSKDYNVGELEFVRRLSLLLQFKYQEGRLKGNNNISLLQEKVYKAYGIKRSSNSIRAMIRKGK